MTRKSHKSENLTRAKMTKGEEDLMQGSSGYEKGRITVSSSEYQVLKQRNRK